MNSDNHFFKVRELAERVSQGQRAELARVVRAIDDKLRHTPLEFGDVYRTRGNVEEHLAAYEFIAIDFAVDQKRKLVLVRGCHGLAGFE